MSKRILFTIPNFDTAGSGAAMLNIARRLNPEKFEVHIACFHDKGDFFETVIDSGIPVHLIQYVSPARPISRLVKSAWKVSRKLKVIRPDLIHSYHYSADYTEALAAKMAGIPWVFTKKNMSWGGNSSNGWKLRSLLAKGIALQNTDMRREFYPGSKKTYSIPRGVNISAFSPAEKAPEILKVMKTPEGRRVIICVANMVPVKGIELLMGAFKRLTTETDHWILWLVGDIDNEYGRTLLSKVKEEQLDHAIRFSGKVSNVRAYLEHAEIFVLPTRNEGRKEGSPVSVLEAMANAKLVVGSNIPGIKDQLEPFPENMFEAGNEDHLVEKLGFFMRQSTSENKKLGRKFKRWVREKYPIDLEVKRHESFYKDILRICD